MTATPSASARTRRGPVLTALATRLATGLLTAATAVAVLLLGATPAAAHASLTGSSPQDGEVVAEAPGEVTLTFSEQVSLAEDAIRVLDPAGERADTGELTDVSEGGTARHAVALRDGLADGTYTVAWQAVSADSHPISGAFTFSIGTPSATDVELPDQAAGEGLVGWLYDIARYGAYAGFLLLAGACVFVLHCWPRAAALRDVQRIGLVGWSALTGSTLALLLLRTPYIGSGELADAFDFDGLRDVVDTRTGTALVIRLLLLAAAGVFLALLHGGYAQLRAEQEDQDPGADPETRADTAERVRDLTLGLSLGGGVLALGIAATWAMAEHASTGRQTALAMPSHVVHLIAVACWLGGLVTLLVLLRREPALPAAAVGRFSPLALSCVTVLAVTGLYQSWRQVGWSWSALTDTDYGQLLILKVALIGVLLAVAWTSRRWTGRLTGGARAVAGAGPGDEAGPAAGAMARPWDAERADTDTDTDTDTDADADADADAGSPPADPVRAKQLERQRRAAAKVRERRLRDADPERSVLRRSVFAEAAIAVVLLVVATALSGTTPAHTAAEAAERETADSPGTQEPGPGASAEPGEPVSITVPFDTGGEFGQGDARIDVDPARTGANAVHIRLFDPQGEPTGAVELGLALTLPAEDLGPLRHEDFLHVDVGHWTVEDVRLPRPGEWEIALTIRTSDIDQVTVTAPVSIP